MKFKYRYFRDTSRPGAELIKLPLLRMRLSCQDKVTDVVGLVDTGAVDCLFDKDVATEIGVDLTASDEELQYVGIGGQSVTGHLRTIQLQIHGFSEGIELRAAFADSKLPFQILGQAGLFDNYEINFKRFRGRFEIKSRSHL